MSLLEKLRQQRLASEAKSGNGPSTVSPAMGRNVYRILPHWAGLKGEIPSIDFGMHFVKGEQVNDKGSNLIAIQPCASVIAGQDCPVCNAIMRVKAQFAGSLPKHLEDLVSSARAQNRIVFNALHRNGEEPNKPIMLALPPTVRDSLILQIEEYATALEKDGDWSPFDLQDGVDFVINRTGSGRSTEYTVAVLPASKPVDPSVMKLIANLDDFKAIKLAENNVGRAVAGVLGIVGIYSNPAPAIANDAPKQVLQHQPAPTVEERPALRAVKAEEAVFTDAEYADSKPAPAPVQEAPAQVMSSSYNDDDLAKLLASIGN